MSSLLFRNKFYTYIIIVWAIIMAYSRIYLGRHFVSDVIGGMVLGSVIGYSIHILYNLATHMFLSGNNLKIQFPDKQIRLLSLGISIYILLFSILSPWLITYLK